MVGVFRILVLVLCASGLATSASAQNWSFYARKVGMGSPTGGENLASRMIEEERLYRSIVLPFGLIQVVRDMDRLNPSKDEFDLVRSKGTAVKTKTLRRAGGQPVPAHPPPPREQRPSTCPRAVFVWEFHV